MQDVINNLFTYTHIHATVRSSTPIILAAIAAVISKQANITNIGIEGIMLFSAFGSMTIAYATKSWVIGLISGVLVGMLISAVIGVVHLKYNTHILVVGFSINMLALGLTRFFLQQIYKVSGVLMFDKPVALPTLRFEALSGNPVLNSIFNNYSLLEPVAILLVFFTWFVLYRTTIGLRLRSVGLYETAAQTAGIDILRTKFGAIVVSGVFAGLAGTHLSMGYTTMFVENMTNGRGFMALAAMNFGNGNPVHALWGCLAFGFSDSIGSRMQSSGIPAQFVLMLPYLVTVAVLSVAMLRRRRKEGQIEDIR